jgi:hypothetical protein
MKRAEREILKITAQTVENEAKRVIGTYDYDWPQLAASTQAQRVRKGFPANEPPRSSVRPPYCRTASRARSPRSPLRRCVT